MERSTRSRTRGARALLAVAPSARSQTEPTATRSMAGLGRRPSNAVVVGVFVASGAAGLIYQVVWSRELVLVFGNTTEAIGTIVTAFMAGLGLGGLVGGLIAPRLRHPLRFYGGVELAIAASALLVPLGFQLIEGAYASAYDTASPGSLTLIRLLLAMATVTPVTFLMGLTLPLLTRHMVTSMRTAGSRMGHLYAANTFGAMLGTLASGFVLIELVGLSATTYVAVGLNALAGIVALLLSRGSSAATATDSAARLEGDDPEFTALRRGLRVLVYVATFVSGFVALALEVLWTRMLAEGTGSRIYIFVVILAVYLLGIAVGGAAYRSASNASRDTPRTLALAFLGIAVTTMLTVPLATWLIPTANSSSPVVVLLVQLRAVMLLPATICMGYAFPLSARLLTRDPAHSSRSIGVLYAWNTVGSLLGSLAAAFVLAGSLGTNGSVMLLGAAAAAAALMLLIAGAGSLRAVPRRISVAAGAMIALAALLVVTGSPALLTATEHRLDAAGAPFQHTEDRISTVDAEGGPPTDRRLYVTGTAMTALSVDTKLMAYVPKIIRPNAQDFLDICFGMGTTFRSSLLLGMHTDAVDLSPSVPLQMPTFYPDAETFLHNPMARVITADGRNYVRLSSRKYDLISVDPPPPIESAGTVVLYTREFYADARQRLRSGGLMLQWLYFGLDLEQFREHLRTFRSAFPHVLILVSPRHGGVYMLGSDASITWDDATVTRFLGTAQATQDVESAPDYQYLPQASWPVILDSLPRLADGDVDRFVGGAPMITDDRPLTEYYFLHHLFAPDSGVRVSETLLRRLWAG